LQHTAAYGVHEPSPQQLGVSPEQHPPPVQLWLPGGHPAASPPGHCAAVAAHPPPWQQTFLSAAQLVPSGQQVAPAGRQLPPQHFPLVHGLPSQQAAPLAMHVPPQQICPLVQQLAPHGSWPMKQSGVEGGGLPGCDAQ